ncbi:MAG: endonuclease [Akkermansiaceae bacterium]|nr:endonuclease [Akkermansiaceae bacterium]
MSGHLDQPVLVLNRFWQPVQTCSVRRALKLLFLGHAQVVQTEGEDRFRTHDLGSWVDHSTREIVADVIHTVRVALRVPKIIVLAMYEKLPRMEVRFTRRNVFLRDKFTCQYCARIFTENDLNLDHVMPRDKGGKTTWDNIVTSCIRCNTRKANKLAHESGMNPLRKPVAPRWRPMFGMRENATSDASWGYFLDPDPGTVRLSA